MKIGSHRRECLPSRCGGRVISYGGLRWGLPTPSSRPPRRVWRSTHRGSGHCCRCKDYGPDLVPTLRRCSTSWAGLRVW